MVHLIFAPTEAVPEDSPEFVVSIIQPTFTEDGCMAHLRRARADAIAKWHHPAIVVCLRATMEGPEVNI